MRSLPLLFALTLVLACKTMPAMPPPSPAATHTASGLAYDDELVGTGPEARAGQRVAVHYTGWLESDGSEFDSSRGRGEPIEFELGAGEVIKGWDEGVAGMKVGGRRRLHIPAELGYGTRGAGRAIPPRAKLVFDVELIAIRE